MPVNLRDRILSSLEAAGITSQRRLAELAELDHKTISHWSTGKTTKPRRNDIEAVSRVLGVNPDWLLTGDGDRWAPPTQYAAKIRRAVNKIGLSPAQIEDRAGILFGTITDALRGKAISPEEATKIALKLGGEIENWLPDPEPVPGALQGATKEDCVALVLATAQAFGHETRDGQLELAAQKVADYILQARQSGNAPDPEMIEARISKAIR